MFIFWCVYSFSVYVINYYMWTMYIEVLVIETTMNKD